MQKVTEDNLVFAKQPQSLINAYKFPIPNIVEMINESNANIKQLEKSFLDTIQHQVTQSPSQTFFAARRHMYNKRVYVVRIQYKFANDNYTNKFSVVVYHAEVIDEQDYQPVLPL